MKKRKNGGFTLVELIIVIAIMAILASAVTIAVIQYIRKAKISNVLEEARAIVNATQNATVTLTTQDFDLNLDKTFTKSDGSTISCGAITNYWLASAQSGTVANESAVDYCDYRIASEVLIELCSDGASSYRFLDFNGAANNPIGQNCKNFFKTYGCPGVIVVYDYEGQVLMLEYFNKDILIHYEDGEFSVSDNDTFIGSSKLRF
ncbi:MAG: type II secretion system GspH family protein [Lachnospiraceae bacterium]|nr:type II secretion system GspH family protein [Lachnospiraceae bacterium]